MRRNRARSLTAAVGAVLLLGAGATSSLAQGEMANNTRPLAVNQTEGYADGQVQVFTYEQTFYCTVEAFDDLDGLGSNGNGKPAAADPLEIQIPRCIAGETDNGSLPTMDPAGIPVAEAEDLPIIIPFFDADNDLMNDTFDATPGVQVQCPEPGPPNTELTGPAFTCTMHPSLSFIEPISNRVGELFTGLPLTQLPDVPVGVSPLPNHSHIVADTENDAVWWQVLLFLVKDPSIWPDFDGNCPAGRDKCLTSVEALDAALADPARVEPEIPTNIWLFFSNQPLHHGPGHGG